MGALASLRFAELGARVVIADLSQDHCEAVADQIATDGGVAVGRAVNVTQADSVGDLMEFAESKFGRVDVVYANAGISPASDDTPEATSVETWDETFAVNAKGVFLTNKYAIPAMRRAGGGSIINVASFVAHMGAATPQIAYTASKGAVLAMTREVAAIYARDGIRANALCPGPVLTPLLAKFLSDEDKRARRLVHIPMGRFGEAIEMVNGAVFLASDESSFMTGQSLIIDGGITSTYTTPL